MKRQSWLMRKTVRTFWSEITVGSLYHLLSVIALNCVIQTPFGRTGVFLMCNIKRIPAKLSCWYSCSSDSSPTESQKGGDMPS